MAKRREESEVEQTTRQVVRERRAALIAAEEARREIEAAREEARQAQRRMEEAQARARRAKERIIIAPRPNRLVLTYRHHLPVFITRPTRLVLTYRHHLSVLRCGPRSKFAQPPQRQHRNPVAATSAENRGLRCIGNALIS